MLVVDDGSTDGDGERSRATAGAEVLEHGGNRGKGHAVRSALARVLAGATSRTCCCSTATCSICPSEAPLLLDAAARTGADVVLGERRFDREAMPASRYHANRIGSRVLSWFVGMPLSGHAVRVPGVPLDALAAICARARAATRSKPRCW